MLELDPKEDGDLLLHGEHLESGCTLSYASCPAGREEAGGNTWSQVESTSRSRNRDGPELKPRIPIQEA